MRLEEARAQWERGLEAKCVVDSADEDVALVILQKGEKYHCHRYFRLVGRWEVSVDRQNVGLEEVWRWLEDPRA